VKGQSGASSTYCLNRNSEERWTTPFNQEVRFCVPIRYSTTSEFGWLVGARGRLTVLSKEGQPVQIAIPELGWLEGLASTADGRAICWIAENKLRWGKLNSGNFSITAGPIELEASSGVERLSLSENGRGIAIAGAGLIFFEPDLEACIRVALESGGTPTHVSWIDDELVQVATAEGKLVTVRYSDAKSVAASKYSSPVVSSESEESLPPTSVVNSEPPEPRYVDLDTHAWMDAPTLDDSLGRDSFRASLGQSIVELTGARDPKAQVPSEFPAILIGGSWGSGKSSVFKQFQEERQKAHKKADILAKAGSSPQPGAATAIAGDTKQVDDFEWKFAHFNAWTNEHLADPAAGLLKALKEFATEGLNPMERFGFRVRELMIRFFGDQGSIAAVWSFAAFWFFGLMIFGNAKNPLAAIGIPTAILGGLKWISGARNIVFWDRFRAAPLRSDRFISGLTETKRLANWYRSEAHRSVVPNLNRSTLVAASIALLAGVIGWLNLQPSTFNRRTSRTAPVTLVICIFLPPVVGHLS
jgi:KAP family P-loop domain